MIVKIVALTSKGEDALRKYISALQDKEREMLKLSKFNPRRIAFDAQQKSAKRLITEEFFDNPLMIVTTLNPKYNDRAFVLVPKIELEFHKLMKNSGCNKLDYAIEVSK